jgi:integrase
MPLKLVPPRKGKSPNWTIRGTYLGVYVDRSSKTDRKSVALSELRKFEQAIECGEYPPKEPTPGGPTFLSAAVAYMQAGGRRKYLAKLISHFGEMQLDLIDQAAIDAAALAIIPDGKPSYRNTNVYTPIAAVLHHAGIDIKVRRPKGWKGESRVTFMTPEDAGAIIVAAERRSAEFALLLRTLLYTGMRISEALALRWEHIALDSRLAMLGRTKNGDPRTMLLREDLHAALAAHRDGRDHGKVFDFRYGGALKDRLVIARIEASGVPVPKRPKGERRPRAAHRLAWVTFHTFRHTWATWMRRYGGLDEIGLVATGNWRDVRSARRYAHAVARDEWAKVDLLPDVAWKG